MSDDLALSPVIFYLLAMSETMPVNPQILIWARETHGFSLDQMTSKFPKLPEWETGERCPTYNQLEQLAKKYHRPLALFFFSQPPKEESIEKSFRSLSQDDSADLSPRMRYIFRKAKAFQISLNELYEHNQAEQKQRLDWLKSIDTKQNIGNIAKIVRKSFNLSPEKQSTWKNTAEALKTWRSLLADHGLYVFKEAFKTDKIAGFCISDDVFPVIFLNNTNQSPSRQVFTLFHELGHLIFQDSTLDVSSNLLQVPSPLDPKPIEVLCNAFASHFLIPEDDFNEKYLSCSTSSPLAAASLTDDKLRDIADRYHVSKVVVLRRFFDKKVINSTFYKDKVAAWEDKETKKDKRKASGGNYDNTKISYLGDAYLSLVLKHYYQGSITVDRASNYLDIPPKSFARIEDSFIGRQSL